MSERDRDIWQNILDLLDEKLQYGFLEQARGVVCAQFEGSELHLTVSTDEALQFFLNSMNQQRLVILCRPFVTLDKVTVAKLRSELPSKT